MFPYKIKIFEKTSFATNCVLYARSKVPGLPFGLFSFKQKKAIINTDKPTKGDVAIIDTGTYWGHVAVVKKVGKRHITIRETNFGVASVTERHNTPARLHVAGYWSPKKKDRRA